MTSEEIKAAAERVRRVNNGERGKVVYGFAKSADDPIEHDDYGHIQDMLNRDRKVLAEAYLSQHARDAEGLDALREMHIAANALLYAIDNGIKLDGVMANMRQKISDSQRLVLNLTTNESGGAMIDVTQLDDRECYKIYISDGLMSKQTERSRFAEWRASGNYFRLFDGSNIHPLYVDEVYCISVDPLPLLTKADQ